MVEIKSGEWESGVGGGQCSSCLRTTIVRGFRDPDDPLDDLDVWLCRPCWLDPGGQDCCPQIAKTGVCYCQEDDRG